MAYGVRYDAQIRTLDKLRLVKRIGKLTPKTLHATLHGLQELFAP
jgi:mRNA-degrading endonuclease toxin of MazEF toxin-antitoxin module